MRRGFFKGFFFLKRSKRKKKRKSLQNNKTKKKTGCAGEKKMVSSAFGGRGVGAYRRHVGGSGKMWDFLKIFFKTVEAKINKNICKTTKQKSTLGSHRRSKDTR